MSERMIHLNIYKGSTHLRLAIVNQCLAYSSTSHTCIIVFIVFIYHQEPLINVPLWILLSTIKRKQISSFISISYLFVLPVTCAIFCVRTNLSLVNAFFSSLTLGDIKR